MSSAGSRALVDLYSLSKTKTFTDLSNLASQLKNVYPPLGLEVNRTDTWTFPSFRADRVSDGLLPDYYKQQDMKPIQTKADGNCLFNAASLALSGSDKLSAELRVRTVIELATNLEFYKNHPNVAKSCIKRRNEELWAVSSLYYAVIFGAVAAKVYETIDSNAAIQQEIKTAAFHGSFSGLLQVMGLASVIRSEIHMIYPDTRHEMLSLLNGIYLPRESSEYEVRPVIAKMWTNLSGCPDRSKILNINHFVPILKISTNTSDNNAESMDWSLVNNKRSRSTLNNGTIYKGEPTPIYSNRRPNKEKRKRPNTLPRPKKRKQPVEDQNNAKAARKKCQQQMPILSQNWFERKINSIPAESENFLPNSNFPPNLNTTMPLLSERFYRKVCANEFEEKFQQQMPILSQNWFKRKTNSIPAESENFPPNSNFQPNVNTTMPLLSERFYRNVNCANEFDTTARREGCGGFFDVHSKQTDRALGISCDTYDRNSYSDTNMSSNFENTAHGSTSEPEGKSMKQFIFSYPLLTEKWFVKRETLACSNEKQNTPSVVNGCVSACPTKSEPYGSKIDSFGCKNTANDTVSNNEILEKNRKTKEFLSQFEPSLPLLSKKWFIRRGRLACKNRSRTMHSQTFNKTLNEKNQVIGLKRDVENNATIQDNVKFLQQQIEKETNLERHAELHAIKEVGKFITEFGPIVSTQRAGKVHEEEKNKILKNLQTK